MHCPNTVGGNPSGISRTLNKLGLVSYVIALKKSIYGYQADKILFGENDSFISREFKKIKAIFVIPWKFDVIHYNFGSTIFSPPAPVKLGENFFRKLGRRIYFLYSSTLQILELSMLKALRRPIFMHYQGNDARQGSFIRSNFKFSIATQVDEVYYNKYTDAFKQKSIERIANYCENIYALNPDLLHVLPKGTKFTPYCHLNLNEWSPKYTQMEKRPLRIGHAPSDRKTKGTQLIIDALDSLDQSGYPFEFILIEGLSNEEARKKYEAIDVLVDQLFAGWYGGLAVEAMALGKPVLVYLREEDFKFVPTKMVEDFPFIQVCPETIRDGLEKLLNMSRSELLTLGKLSRRYVEKWHDPMRIVDDIKSDYERALRARLK